MMMVSSSKRDVEGDVTMQSEGEADFDKMAQEVQNLSIYSDTFPLSDGLQSRVKIGNKKGHY